MIHELWVEKYRPQKVNDIIGNQKILTQAQDWFIDYLNGSHTKNALLFSGPPGLGKTTMAHCLLKEYGFRVKEFNASDIRSQKQVEENLYQLIEVDYVDKIYGQTYEPFGIIMDEVDGMLAGDRGGLNSLISFINSSKRSKKSPLKNQKTLPPIICICNNVDRKILTLVKDCIELKFSKPKDTDLSLLIDKVCLNENLNLNVEAKPIILQIAQGDYRRLVYFLQFLFGFCN